MNEFANTLPLVALESALSDYENPRKGIELGNKVNNILSVFTPDEERRIRDIGVNTETRGNAMIALQKIVTERQKYLDDMEQSPNREKMYRKQLMAKLELGALNLMSELYS